MFAFTYEEKKKMAAQTAEILREEIGLKGDALQAVSLIPEIDEGKLSLEDVEEQYGPQVSRILHGRIPSSRARTSVTCCSPLPRICASS